jgi:hypothetical protein
MDAIAAIADMIREAELHADHMSKDRVRAVEYYQGEMHDTPSDKGRSRFVSRDVRATIKKVLPSVMRTILGNETIVEYQPVNQGDEQGAEQATEYVNRVVLQESDGYRAIEDAVHDALLLRNGILSVCFEQKTQVTVTQHSGLLDDAFAQLVAEPDVEVLEHSERMEMTDLGPATVHDLKIRRTVQAKNIKAAAIPRERFLIHPDAITLEDSILTGSKTQMRRSDLVAMGYNKDLIWGLPTGDDDDDDERDTRRDFVGDAQEAQRANEPVDYYDLYVRFDKDGDGIAELRHMCFAGGMSEKNLLVDEDADDVYFADIKVLSQPHQWEGISIFDDVEDLQRIKTVLTRQTLDNLYWQNNPQPTMQRGAIANPDAVHNPEFGLPIEVNEGFDVRSALGFNTVPFVAAQSFGMLEYMDGEVQDRTGVSDASSGLAPDALQNMTAKASAMIEQAGIGQTELMVKTLAVGLRRFFRLILKLVVKHQDVPRTVRLRGEWVQYDPRSWNADMDCTVNTGLGAGTRERDMQMMQFVLGTQEKLLASFGALNNPYVTPENLFASLSKLVQAAGLKSVDAYFTEPDPQIIQQKAQEAASQPSPEQLKMQAQMQVEQAKMQFDVQKAQAQMQAEASKEREQRDADLIVAKAKLEADKERAAFEAQVELQKQEREIAWQREKLLLEQRLTLATQGLSQGPDGGAVNDTTEGIKASMAQIQQVLMMLGQQMAASSRPKRVVRDQMGEIVGLETYDPAMMN